MVWARASYGSNQFMISYANVLGERCGLTGPGVNSIIVSLHCVPPPVLKPSKNWSGQGALINPTVVYSLIRCHFWATQVNPMRPSVGGGRKSWGSEPQM